MKTTLDIRMVALQRALQLLNSCNAKYKVIAEDGSEYGTLNVVKHQPLKRQLAYPVGMLRNYYGPFIQNMNVGDVVLVPLGQFDFDRLQGGIGSLSNKLWGNRSVITRRDPVRNAIEVLRVS
jgi:hypothetical protein